MGDLRLVVWDVDGTLVDSAAHITGAMTRAFHGQDLTPPSPDAVRDIVGLSLPQAIAALAPDVPADQQQALREGYKGGFVELAQNKHSSPLFPGTLDVLNEVHSWDETLMGVATGKSRRGLDRILDAHDLRPYFVTQQVADFHPSKPHPAMLQAAMDDAGVGPDQTVMIGDTSFDIDMGRAAGTRTIAVAWGNHHTNRLKHADALAQNMQELPALLQTFWGQ